MMQRTPLYCLLSACLAIVACSSSTTAPQGTATPATAAPAAAAEPEPAAAPAESPPAATETTAAAQPAAAAEASPPADPPIPLEETPADKLGSAPTGFGLAVGAKAPDATLPDVTGKSQRLAALYRSGPTFVVFYRGGWCPFCNLQLHRLSEAMPEFEKKGFKIVAISVDMPSEESKTQAQQGVPFPMLSDSDLIAHKAFHVVHTTSEEDAAKFAKYGVDLEKYSGKPHHSYAVASIFLIDRAGKIRWRHVDEDYKTRPSAAQMLEVADRTLKKKK